MQAERESNEIKKSMAYDLLMILKDNPQKETYSVEEIENLITTYIRVTTSNN